MTDAATLDDDLRMDLLALARDVDGRWSATPWAAEARRILTRRDPKLFCTIYLSKHLKGPETGDKVTFSEFHDAVYDEGKRWLDGDPGPAEERVSFVAPRGAAKTTLGFLGLPMWAGCHGVIDFIAAFADSASQAELHLQTFKRELDTNELLRHDFPEMVKPARRPSGTAVSDHRSMYLAANGFVFVAKGIDSSSLGMKVGERRPRLLIFDDLEPDESNYSAAQKDKRLATLREAAFPLNINARVLMLGTTTMHGSVMHDIARQVTEPDECPAWVAEENIRTVYFPAILTDDDGTERSMWPERWPMAFLEKIRHTRNYAKNYDNRPVNLDGNYWTPDHFFYSDAPEGLRILLSIDPAGTSKTDSDHTGLAVIGYSVEQRRAWVLHAVRVKLTPAKLREMCLRLIQTHGCQAALIETNSGGDAWPGVLNLPVKTVTVHQTVPKPVRASQVLDYYEARWVEHAKKLPAFENEACAFTGKTGGQDDLVDAVGSGLHFFLKDRRGTRRPRETATAYA